MKIFAISVVKNEADVIEENLKAASKWADKIFVLDNGSTDGTWEKVQALADDVITPWKQIDVLFYDGLRAEVYNEFRHMAEYGDWWCIRLDGDEFYKENPRTFLQQVPAKYHFVCAKFIQYRLTHEELAQHEFTGRFEEDRAFIKHFDKTAWAEIRFVRHRPKLQWAPSQSFPKHIGIVFPKLIMMLHYQHRSPKQVQDRLDIRHKAMALNNYHAPHNIAKKWQDVVKHQEGLYSDSDDVNVSNIPVDNRYLHRPYVYWIKRLLHGLKILP